MHMRTRWTWAIFLAMALAVTCSAALGADAPAPVAQPQPDIWSKLFNSTFGLVLLFIFLPVVITTFVAARQRDRCLKMFHGFHATAWLKTGKAIWGTLQVFSKGIVLSYATPHEPARQPVRTSYMFYEADMQNVFAVFRFHDQITSRNQRRRERQIRRLAYPGPIRRTWRKIRNLVNTLKDAFSKAIGAFLGQVQKVKPTAVLTTGGKDIESVGTTLLGRVANAYEPLLERHIGEPVVLELSGPGAGEKREYAGQLAEYSATYLMVLDIDAEIDDSAVVGGPGAFNDQVQVTRTDAGLDVRNSLSVEVHVKSVTAGPNVAAVEVTIPAGGTGVLNVVGPVGEAPVSSEASAEGAKAQQVTVELVAQRKTDIMAPRANAVIRHGGVRRR